MIGHVRVAAGPERPGAWPCGQSITVLVLAAPYVRVQQHVFCTVLFTYIFLQDRICTRRARSRAG